MATILHLRFETCNGVLITRQNDHFRFGTNTLMKQQNRSSYILFEINRKTPTESNWLKVNKMPFRQKIIYISSK